MEKTSHSRTRRQYVIYGILGILALSMLVWIACTAFFGKEWATIEQGDTQAYMVRVADNVLEKRHGLAGSEPADLGDAIGMLFVFNDAMPRSFTMRGMKYDLDFLWLREGKIVRIDRNVAAPVAGKDPVELSSYPLDVDMVVEMPAGTVAQLQYLVGHELTINLDAE